MVKRNLSYAAVFVAVLAGGWLLQMGVARAERNNPGERLFNQIADRVRSDFVGEVDTDLLYESAVEGLLAELGDPYSSYIPARAYENLRIQTEGDYGGLGLEVVYRDGRVTVVNTIPGTPGARAGIREGDAFFEIDGIRADTMITEQTVALLRGRPGTSVRVKMTRPGVPNPIDFEIERAVIRLRAVPFATIVDGVAYVPLEVFRETTTDEVSRAIDSLSQTLRESEGTELAGLVLDLRNNPGGLLSEGVSATDLFLDEGSAVVETRGRRASESVTYRAENADRFPDLPMVVLVNGSSASASEILAGALQDHDRATVVGETTFGKGSVQTYYTFRDGDALRLTTSKWYTPVGRTISRVFAEERGSSRAERGRQEDEKSHGPFRISLRGRIVAPVDTAGRPRYESMSGRVLFGGGGVVPDRFVAPELLSEEEEEATRALSAVAGGYSSARFGFAVEYIAQHPDLEVGFTLSESDLDEFVTRLAALADDLDRALLSDARRFLRHGLEREIAAQAFGDLGAFLQTMAHDRQLSAAIGLLSDGS